MPTPSMDFKRKVAGIYLKRKFELENFDPKVMKAFSKEILELINEEKKFKSSS